MRESGKFDFTEEVKQPYGKMKNFSREFSQNSLHSHNHNHFEKNCQIYFSVYDIEVKSWYNGIFDNTIT